MNASLDLHVCLHVAAVFASIHTHTHTHTDHLNLLNLDRDAVFFWKQTLLDYFVGLICALHCAECFKAASQ